MSAYKVNVIFPAYDTLGFQNGVFCINSEKFSSISFSLNIASITIFNTAKNNIEIMPIVFAL